MNWQTVKKWLQLGRELGFRLLREDCRHCGGTGICHSGRSEFAMSCASCQQTALGRISGDVVRCEACQGRGVHVYALPDADLLRKVTIEVLPKDGEQWSIVRVRNLEASSNVPPLLLPEPSDR